MVWWFGVAAMVDSLSFSYFDPLFLSLQFSLSNQMWVLVYFEFLLWVSQISVDQRSKLAAGTEDRQRQCSGLQIDGDGMVVWSSSDGGFSLFLSFRSSLSLTLILSLRLDMGFGFALNFLQVQSESFCFFFLIFVLFFFFFDFVVSISISNGICISS